MARKPNYGYDKRRKEQDRKAKKDAKALDKQQRRDERAAEVNVDPAHPTRTSGPTAPMPLPSDEGV